MSTKKIKMSPEVMSTSWNSSSLCSLHRANAVRRTQQEGTKVKTEFRLVQMQKQVLGFLIGQVSFVGGANAVKEPHHLRGRVTEVRVSGERDLNLFDDTCGFKWNSAQSRLQKFDMTSESEASLR